MESDDDDYELTIADLEEILAERSLSLDIYDTAPWSARVWARDDPLICTAAEGETLELAILGALEEWDTRGSDAEQEAPHITATKTPSEAPN